MPLGWGGHQHSMAVGHAHEGALAGDAFCMGTDLSQCAFSFVQQLCTLPKAGRQDIQDHKCIYSVLAVGTGVKAQPSGS